MKTLIHKTGRESEALISAIIVLALVLAVVAVMHLRARGFRDTANLQLDTDNAYSLAKGGVGVAESFIPAGGGDPCLDFSCGLIQKTYNLGDGKSLKIDIDPCNGTLTSTGKVGKSVRIVKRLFPPVTPPVGFCPLWAKAYARPATERMSDIIATGDGQYLVDGWEEGGSNGLIAKIQANGTISWAKNISAVTQVAGDVSSKTLLEVSDGYMCLRRGAPAATSKFTLIKMNKTDGTKIWAKDYNNTTGAGKPTCLAVDNTGDYILGGQTLNTGTRYSGYVIKVNATGVPLKAYTYNGSQTENIVAVIPYMEGTSQRYLLAGNTNSSLAYGAGDVFAIKTNDTFAPLISRVYGYSTTKENFMAGCLSINPSTGQPDGFLLAGYRDAEAMMIKVNLTLNTTWVKQTGASGSNDSIQDVIQDPADGSYILAGIMPRNGLNPYFCRLSFDGVTLSPRREYLLVNQSGDDQFWGVSRATSSPAGLMFGGETSYLGGTGTTDWLLTRTNTTGDITNCAFSSDPAGTVFFDITVVTNKSATFTSTDRTAALKNATSAATINDTTFTPVSVCH